MAGGDIQTSRLKALDNTAHYSRMRDSGHLEYLRKATLCRNYVLGKQWDPAVKAQLDAEGRPALTINKVFPAVMAMMGEQLQNMVDISFRPTASGSEETAKALDTVWLHIANSNMLDWVRAEVFDDGAITSRGFYDMRMVFDDNLYGDVQIKRLMNRNVLVDPDANSYDPKDWSECAITKWLSPAQVANTYDTAHAKEIETRASMDTMHGYDFLDYPMARFGGAHHSFGTVVSEADRKKFVRVVERQHKELVWREHFVDRVTGEIRPVPPTWSRDRISYVLQNIEELAVIRRQTFSIRWTVTALDILLFDAESPYRYFTPVPYFPLLMDGETMGLVESQIGPQDTVNKSTSQELHIVNTTANSGWKVKKGALQNMDIYDLEHVGAKTGLVVELDDLDGLEKIQPNQIPTGLDRISQRARQDLFEVSLVNKSQLGIDREDVSGKAMERKQLRGPVNMGKAFGNLVRSEHILARNSVALVQAFYTEERALRVTRKNRGRDETVEVVINQMTPEGNVVNNVTLGEYGVITSTVSLREQSEDTEFDQAVQLRELGVDIPDEMLVPLSRLRNKKEVLENLQASSQARAEDLEVEREMKKLELEQARTDIGVSKTDAAEKVARAQRTGAETQLVELEKRAELAKIATELQKARNEEAKLALEARRLDAEIEQNRRELRLQLAQTRQKATTSKGT